MSGAQRWKLDEWLDRASGDEARALDGFVAFVAQLASYNDAGNDSREDTETLIAWREASPAAATGHSRRPRALPDLPC